MEHTTGDARALIRAAQEVHVERHGAQTFVPGTRLSFLEAAKRTGIRPDRQRYRDAIDDLEYEGAIEWDTSARYARGDKHYLITRRGLDGAG
jgi:RNA:NAD 2'-phosphotransferase (TPT1/KptA family)